MRLADSREAIVELGHGGVCIYVYRGCPNIPALVVAACKGIPVVWLGRVRSNTEFWRIWCLNDVVSAEVHECSSTTLLHCRKFLAQCARPPDGLGVCSGPMRALGRCICSHRMFTTTTLFRCPALWFPLQTTGCRAGSTQRSWRPRWPRSRNLQRSSTPRSLYVPRRLAQVAQAFSAC